MVSLHSYPITVLLHVSNGRLCKRSFFFVLKSYEKGIDMFIVTLNLKLTSSIYISLLNLLGYLRSNKYHIFVTFSVCRPSI